MSSIPQFAPLALQDITPETSAYTKHFQWIVKSIVQDRPEFKCLLLEEEVLLGQKLLSLSPVGMLLYAKLPRVSPRHFLVPANSRKVSSVTKSIRVRSQGGLQRTVCKRFYIFPLDGKMQRRCHFSHAITFKAFVSESNQAHWGQGKRECR